LADIFVSYTSSDQDWAFWIGTELEKLGYTPYVHGWEIGAGENILEWMETRLKKADHALFVVSSRYLTGPYSKLELQTAIWRMQQKPSFALPVYVEKCDEPLFLQHINRCDLYEYQNENTARAALVAYLTNPAPPRDAPFPRRVGPAQASPRSPNAVPFPGKRVETSGSAAEASAPSVEASAVIVSHARIKAHIVGGGFGGLAAAALLIRNAGIPGEDITIYEADREPGGGFFLRGDAQSGYNLPGSVFDKEFRCAFSLLASIPTRADPTVPIRDQFFAFNKMYPLVNQTHILDRDLHAVHSPRFGLSLGDGHALARLSLTPETALDGRRIEQFFPPKFFETEFWLLWSTIMKSLPQHSAIEFRRYINRFIYLFHDFSVIAHVLRSPFNQHEALIKPLVAWLRPRGVNFLTEAFVQDVSFAPSPGQMTVNRLDYERDGSTRSVAIAPKDIVLVTTGSQAADLSIGSMIQAPQPLDTGRSWVLWKRLSKEHKGFGNPDAFFGADRIGDSRWVTFTVTTTGTEFIDQVAELTSSASGNGAFLILKDSSWVLSLSIFREPEILDQPPGTSVWWGNALYPQRNGDFVKKRMDQCTGAEILEEVLGHLRFEKTAAAIMRNSICNPCNLPYVHNIWLPRKRGDRPPVVPEGATNLGPHRAVRRG
jgi:oleate hydratase